MKKQLIDANEAGELSSKTLDKTPILRGFVVGNAIHVHCPFCDCFHVHGWEPGETKPTSRVAHCHNQNSPYDDSGYYVAPFRRKDMVEIEKAKAQEHYWQHWKRK